MEIKNEKEDMKYSFAWTDILNKSLEFSFFSYNLQIVKD